MSKSAAAESHNYDIVNTFQGAFGPPTRGHYESMVFTARQTLEDNKSGQKILMLFMPTYKSGSKPHLLITYEERIKALYMFCKLLKEEKEFADAPIFFEVSRIESETLKPETIHTLEALQNKYKVPADNLILTLGLDNFLDLPFWSIEKYNDYTKKIYVLNRDVSEDDQKKQKEITIKGKPIMFNMYASYSKNYKIYPEHIKPADDTDNLTLILAKNNSKIQEVLENTQITFLGKPSATSSSLLRVALKLYYCLDPPAGSPEDYYNELYKKISNLSIIELPPRETIDPFIMMTLKTNHLEKDAKLLSFDEDYKTAFPSKSSKQLSSGGFRKTKSRKIKSKRGTSKKNII